MIVNILVSFESIYLILNILDRIYPLILSENVKDKFERIILWGAIISFVVHLALIFFNQIGWLQMANGKGLLTNPISAIYTPFSFAVSVEDLLCAHLCGIRLLYINGLNDEWNLIKTFINKKLKKCFEAVCELGLDSTSLFAWDRSNISCCLSEIYTKIEKTKKANQASLAIRQQKEINDLCKEIFKK